MGLHHCEGIRMPSKERYVSERARRVPGNFLYFASSCVIHIAPPRNRANYLP